MAKSDASSSLRTMEMWLLPFAAMFTRPSWLNAVALATGALLCLNRRHKATRDCPETFRVTVHQ